LKNCSVSVLVTNWHKKYMKSCALWTCVIKEI